MRVGQGYNGAVFTRGDGPSDCRKVVSSLALRRSDGLSTRGEVGDQTVGPKTIERHPANASLIRYLARKGGHSGVRMFDPLRRLDHDDEGSGSHPEVVERVWDHLGPRGAASWAGPRP